MLPAFFSKSDSLKRSRLPQYMLLINLLTDIFSSSIDDNDKTIKDYKQNISMLCYLTFDLLNNHRWNCTYGFLCKNFGGLLSRVSAKCRRRGVSDHFDNLIDNAIIDIISLYIERRMANTIIPLEYCYRVYFPGNLFLKLERSNYYVK